MIHAERPRTVPRPPLGHHGLTRHGLTAVVAGALLIVVADARTPAHAQAGPDGTVAGLKSKFVTVNGVSARYYEEGQGEPMVLIHGGSTGGSSTANVWSRNIPGLARRFHVFALDRLGSGLTGNPADNEYGTPAQVEFVYQFIKALKLSNVHLVGHSAGGAIAFYAAIEHPALFKTLTIVAHGPANPRLPEDGQRKLDAMLPKCPDQNVYDGLKCRVELLGWGGNTFDAEYWAADTYMANLPKSKAARAAVAATANDPARAAQTTAYREKAWDKVKNGGVLQMPVLMYAGKQDVLDWSNNEPVAMLRGELRLFDILGAKNPRVSMVIVNEGGHFMYREHPEKFNADLVGFIDFWNRSTADRTAK